jgi:hypothetical protein
MGQHLNDIKKLITKGIKSDSFASHFANHCKRETKPTNDELRRMMAESQNHLARERNELQEVVWEIKLFIVYAREN